MNAGPFEITKDPGSGLPTVRVKHGFVVLTKEDDERNAERIVALKELTAGLFAYAKLRTSGACECDDCTYRERCAAEDPESYMAIEWFEHDMRELGIEVG